ncbi:MAG: hypothetical protein ACPGUC_09900 [Gammaproteobacteria bacterium]
MLAEIDALMDEATEPGRRWFHDEAMDLFTWSDASGDLVRFELTTRCGATENAVTWTAEQGLCCYRVDGGEDDPQRNRTPVFIAGMVECLPSIAGRFRVVARLLDEGLRDPIQECLREGLRDARAQSPLP